MDDVDLEFVLNESLSAAGALWIVVGELIVELVVARTLSRKGAANILVRNERSITHLPEHDVSRYVHQMLFDHVCKRLALQPEIYVRRLRDQKEQEDGTYPRPPLSDPEN